jgi:hypothetical protein
MIEKKCLSIIQILHDLRRKFSSKLSKNEDARANTDYTSPFMGLGPKSI